jgi:hypothetical protein
LPKIVLLAGGAVAVGWLAVKSAAFDALVKRSPYAAAAVSPEDPRVAFTLAMKEFRQKQGAVPPALAELAIGSLQKAPLAEEPFFLAASGALVRGDGAKAETLLTEAKRRNPRSRATRILLLDRHLRAGRIEQAAVEISGISRLMPAARNVLVPEIARFANDPKTSGALADILRTDPELKRSLLEHLASSGAKPETVLRLAGSDLGPFPHGQSPAWQQQLLASLVNKGEVAQARSLWSRFAGASSDAASVYDGRFERRPGPPPFNWQFASSAAGVAEPSNAQALQVEYYGRVDAELASQLLTLAPGRYQLGFRAAGDTPERGSSVSWRLVCHPNKVEIAAAPVNKLTYAPRPIAVGFVVPPTGCSGQWLRLIGTPAEFPTTHSITISNLQVRKASGS